MLSVKLAAQGKADKHLSTLIRTSQYGICTRAQRLEQAMVDGSTLEAASVRDEARERKIEREIAQLKGRDGWGIPTGNESHPRTIQWRKLQAELAAGPMMIEYRLHRPDKEYWNILTKTEFEYASSLTCRFCRRPLTFEPGNCLESGMKHEVAK